MKPIFLALLVLLVLGGAGVGGYLYFYQPVQAAATDGEEGQGEAHAKKDNGHGAGRPGFVRLDPLVLPIVDNNGISQSVSIVVTLATASENDAKELQYLAPRFTDAYIRNMYGMLNQSAIQRGGLLPVEAIKRRLNSISRDMPGGELIEEVLLQVVQQRPI